MQWTSTANRYGALPMTIHWVTAIAVVVLLISGLQAAATADPATEVLLLRIHATLGITVLLLTVLRIVWWWRFDRTPPDPANLPVWQSRTAHVVRILLYVAILALGSSGIAMLALSGAAATLFFGAATPLPDFWAYLPRGPHGIIARVLLGLALFHVIAALYHQFVRRDHLLARMGLGR